MGYIYLRKNLSNGKCYVGQTVDIKTRNRQWKNLNYRYAGKVINKARAKYGVDGFSFELLKECEDDELNQWETYYVKEYNSKAPNGYNMTDGGDSVYEITEETKAKLSAAKRGKHYPKLSAALRGKPKPKVAAARRGMKLSEETKARMSVAQKTSEKAKIGRTKAAAARRGKKHSPEHVAKIAAAESKAVQALDKDGNVVMEFASTQEAQRQGFSSGDIAACCLGKRKTHKGFIWRYAEK